MTDTIFSDDPLVTVVIPTYNRSMLVMDAIASVLAQTYTHWELIVADDGSQDDTIEKIRAITDPRIRLLALPHCGNIATVRNAGAGAGSGRWIAFLDSDDLWIPEKLEIQVCLLRKTGKRWTYSGYELIDEAGRTMSAKAGVYTPFSGWIIKPLLTTEASVNMGTLVLERTLFNELGGFDPEPRINFREDYEIAIRLAMKAETIAIPEPLMKIREHKERVTSSYEQGNARTAAVYLHFLKTRTGDGMAKPEKELLQIARRQLAWHLAEEAGRNIKRGNFLQAARQWGRALINGDKWGHLGAVLFRGAVTGKKR